MTAAAYRQIQQAGKNKWMHDSFALIDSGATDSVVHDSKLLHCYRRFKQCVTVSVGDGTKLTVLGYGTLVLHLRGGTLAFRHTLHVPSLKCNILSVSGMAKSGYTSVFSDVGVCVFSVTDDDAIPLLRGKLVDSLYLIDMQNQKHASIIGMDTHTPAHLVQAARKAWEDQEDGEDVEPDIEEVARSITLTCAHLYQADCIAELLSLIHI
jgi:hypothetical protein